MIELQEMTSVQASEAVQELDGLADMLGMPGAERYSILGLSRDAYHSWRNGNIDAYALVRPELARRLNYALPLMRRIAANTPMVPAGRSQNRPRPAVN